MIFILCLFRLAFAAFNKAIMSIKGSIKRAEVFINYTKQIDNAVSKLLDSVREEVRDSILSHD